MLNLQDPLPKNHKSGGKINLDDDYKQAKQALHYFRES